MKIAKVLAGLVIVAVLVGQTGCGTYMAHEYNRKNALLKKAQSLGNDVAIKAIQLDNNGVGIGIDVTLLDTLDTPKAWLVQGAGALVDAATIYAAEQGLSSLTQSSNEKDNSFTVNNGGNGSVSVNITQNTSTSTSTTDTRSNTSIPDSSSNSHNIIGQ